MSDYLDPETMADLESAFTQIGPFDHIKDADLPTFVEGFEAFMNALAPLDAYKGLYDVRASLLRDYPDVTTWTADGYCCAGMRQWLTEAKRVCKASMAAAGIEHCVVWVFHEGRGFKQWQLLGDEESPAMTFEPEGG